MFGNNLLFIRFDSIYSCECLMYEQIVFGSHRPGLISIRQMDEKPRLIYPSDFVVKVVKFAENVLNCELKEENWLKKVGKKESKKKRK